MFRGREMVHPERGLEILDKLADELRDMAIIENEPKQEGRNVFMLIAPVKVPEKDKKAAEARPRPPRAEPRGRAASRSDEAEPRRPAEQAESTPEPQETTTMPKMKTHRGAAKRFKATGTGKLKRVKAYHSHILEHKSPKRKRNLGQSDARGQGRRQGPAQAARPVAPDPEDLPEEWMNDASSEAGRHGQEEAPYRS